MTAGIQSDVAAARPRIERDMCNCTPHTTIERLAGGAAEGREADEAAEGRKADEAAEGREADEAHEVDS